MNEIMYDHSSLLIVGVLFVVLIVVTEVGFRLGFKSAEKVTDGAKSQINTIQVSLLGVLALLLGFTFSLSLQRFDSRSEAVIAEANAIGTAMLRAGVLPELVRTETQGLLDQYLGQRIAAGEIPLNREAERDAVLRLSEGTLAAIWGNVERAVEADANPVTTGLFVQAVNDMIDAYGTRDAALDRHVPEPVLFLMFVAFVLTVCLVGYSAGVSGHRANFAIYILVILVTCLVFVVIDLDRPRRGLIEVSQQSLMDLQASRAQALE